MQTLHWQLDAGHAAFDEIVALEKVRAAPPLSFSFTLFGGFISSPLSSLSFPRTFVP